jgi:hypothetical protein
MKGKLMRSYSIPDLLVGTYYRPTSLARRYNGGEINFAEKRDDVWVGTDYQAYAIRYNGSKWATIAVKVSDL